jgi:hypothetical protein
LLKDDLYLVWSNEHRGWWKAGGWGYDAGLKMAGRFSRDEAIRICREALPTAARLRVISEIPVRVADVIEMLEGQAVPACVMASDVMKP